MIQTKKIPDTSGLVTKRELTTISEIESKIPGISGLAANSALTPVENKIPDASSLVKKKQIVTEKLVKFEKKVTDYNHYITIPEINNLTGENLAARLAQENLITKTDFHTKLMSLNLKINSNKTKILLVENEFKKLQTFDSSYFRSKSHFDEDEAQNYLIFQPIGRYLKKLLVLEMMNVFIFGNLKVCLIKGLIILLHLIIVLLLH